METLTDYQKQAEDFLKETNTTLKIKYLKYDYHFADDKEKRDIYRVTLKRGRKSYTFNFGQSLNNTQKSIVPSSYEILTCLTKENPEDFENFCSNFGYDTDSIEASKVYKSVIKEWEGIKRVFDVDSDFGEDNTILNHFREIQ